MRSAAETVLFPGVLARITVRATCCTVVHSTACGCLFTRCFRVFFVRAPSSKLFNLYDTVSLTQTQIQLIFRMPAQAVEPVLEVNARTKLPR